MFISLVEQL